MSDNIFLKDNDFYKRDINPLKQYTEQSAFYLSKMTNKSIDECSEFIISGIKSHTLPNIKDPDVTFYERNDNGDKHKTECKLSNYISSVIKNDEILVPTFTTYLSSKVKESLLVEFVDHNAKVRSIAKKEAFKAKADNNIDLFIMKNNEQNNRKLYNNSMSGAFATKGCALYNPTAHSTLTSMTRTESSLGNASNEKIIAGNRHYKDPETTLNNIISIASSINRKELLEVMTKYNLHYPSSDEVIECIKYSTDLYWKDEKAFIDIREFIEKLDNLELAGFMYISDLYHIRKYNSDVVRDFLRRLSSKTHDVTLLDPLNVIKTTDEQIVNFVHQICMSETKGIGKKYNELDNDKLITVASTCQNVTNTISMYKDFINAFFLTSNVPASTAYIPSMLRRSVVLSDTDSTMFSVDEFIIWYFGDLVFSDEAYAVASSLMFLATQCIAHVLAIFSANLNVARHKLFHIAMKPEFTFPVFIQTSVAKHYYTCILVKEGNVYKDIEMEIKGVHMKNSAAPKILIDNAHEKMKAILTSIMNNEKISLIKELNEVSTIEKHITNSLLNGNVEYFKKSKIKNSEAYTRAEENSPYVYHLLWEKVFSPKYGKIEPPPYDVIKIPTTVINVTKLKEWFSMITDKELSTRLSEYLLVLGKTELPTIYIPIQYVKSFGVPDEIKCIVNIKKIVLELTMVNRMILESLGYFSKTELLISEQGY